LNAKLVRADKAWAQWLVSVVADFVTTREASRRPFEDAAEKWVERLLAASTTKLALRIARQVRRELARLRAIEPTSGEETVQTCYVPPPPTKAPRLTILGCEMVLEPEHPLVMRSKGGIAQGPPRPPSTLRGSPGR